MADRTATETPQATAAPQASSPPVTEELYGPAVSAPMLDVHAPHETLHTWKDCATHIAATVVGLPVLRSGSCHERSSAGTSERPDTDFIHSLHPDAPRVRTIR
jgi:hypothetical protein